MWYSRHFLLFYVFECSGSRRLTSLFVLYVSCSMNCEKFTSTIVGNLALDIFSCNTAILYVLSSYTAVHLFIIIISPFKIKEEHVYRSSFKYFVLKLVYIA